MAISLRSSIERSSTDNAVNKSHDRSFSGRLEWIVYK